MRSPATRIAKPSHLDAAAAPRTSPRPGWNQVPAWCSALVKSHRRERTLATPRSVRQSSSDLEYFSMPRSSKLPLAALSGLASLSALLSNVACEGEKGDADAAPQPRACADIDSEQLGLSNVSITSAEEV